MKKKKSLTQNYCSEELGLLKEELDEAKEVDEQMGH